MALKLTGAGQPVVPDQGKQRYTDADRPIGSASVLRGRRVQWAGPGWRWQSPASFERLKRTGKLNRSIFSDPIGVIGNELRYIGRKVAETNRRGAQSSGMADTIRQVVAPSFGLAAPLINPPGGQTGRNVVAALSVGVAENAAKFAVSAGQKVRGQRANPEASPAGNAIERLVDSAYSLYGATPPSRQNDFERNLDLTVRSVGSSAAATSAVVPLIPAMGTGAAGLALTGGARWAAGEVLSTFLDDNRAGNISNLGEAVGLNLPLAVDVGRDDWIDSALKSLLPNAVPGAALSGLGAGVAGLRNTRRWLSESRARTERTGARQQLEQAGITETDPTTGATSFRDPEGEAQAQQQIDNWIEAGRTPEAEPAPAAGGAAPAAAPEPPATAAAPDRPAAPEQPAGAGDSPLAVEGEIIDPGELIYDPALPEADVVLNLVRDLNDEDLLGLLQQPGPVVPRIDELLTARQGLPVEPELEQGRVMAPAGNVAERMGREGQPQTYEQTLESVRFESLRSVAAPENNPDLAQIITEATGRDFEEFTKADIIEGLARYREETGQELLARDWQQSFRPVGEIQADPQRFQFKQGTNEQGEQIGNSLSGVNRWDTVAEGVIDVWTDPADGITYVVNGHNRLARAKQLGIPTVPVRELVAATAEEARALGALANIKEGRGTVFDAAKFMRDSGITDAEQLQRMGAPMSDGNSAKGLALSKLPGNIFQDAVDGKLSQGKAIALGGAGFDEGQMQAAVKILGNRDMSDAAFNEVLQQVRSAPVTKPGDNPQTTLLDLFGMNDDALSLAVEKGTLAAKIRADLTSDKNLFGKVGKKAERLQQAGNKISVEGSASQAMDARAVLGVFDAVKYAPGPVSDLLDEGARQIADGAKPGVVANRIRDRIVEAVRRASEDQGLPMARPAGGSTPGLDAPPTREELDAVQLDPETQGLLDEMEGIARSLGDSAAKNAETARRMLETSAGIEDIDGGKITDRIVPGPRQLTPEQRQAAQIDVIRRAVGEGEVRPPESQLPELPDGPAVPLGEATADLDGQGARPQPGTRGAQAAADELRLAAEFHERDQQMRRIAEEGLRDATGYELKSFEEKKQLGMADGYDPEPPRGPSIDASIPPDSKRGDKSSLDFAKLVYGPNVSPTERRQLLDRVGRRKGLGMWTLGDEGAADAIERDIIDFAKRITGNKGKIVIADQAYIESDMAGYGRPQETKPRYVQGAAGEGWGRDPLVLIARKNSLFLDYESEEVAQTAIHEAVHVMQRRFLTPDQLQILASDESVKYFRREATKMMSADDAQALKNVELMAWGSQRVIAARLLQDMADTYRSAGKVDAADYLLDRLSKKLGEYSPPPAKTAKALKPLIEIWERIKNYLLGVGFKLNRELPPEVIELLAQFTDEIAPFSKTVARAIDPGLPRPSADLPPKDVAEILDAAYSGEIAKQFYLEPEAMGAQELKEYSKRYDILYSTPARTEAKLADAPIRPEPMTLMDEAGPLPVKARTKVADQAARKQIEANNQRIDEIRRKSLSEGCSL